MHKRVQSALMAALFLAGFALPVGAAPPWRRNASQDLNLKEILARMDQAGKHLKTFSADLEYTKVTVLVNDRSTETGRIYYRSGRSPEIHIVFTRPAGQQFLLRKNKGEFYQPTTNQIQEFDLSNHPDLVQQFFLLGFGADTKDLKKAYDIRYLKEEKLEGNQTAVIELVPRDPKVKNQLSKVQLWINEESWVPFQQKFFEPSGDYMTARYSDVKTNRYLPNSLFRIKAKGAKIIKMQ